METLDLENILSSLQTNVALYGKVYFNEKAKFRLMKSCALKVNKSSVFRIYSSTNTYKEVKEVFLGCDSGVKAYFFTTSFPGLRQNANVAYKATKDASQIIIRPASRVLNVGKRIDLLSNQLW